MLEKEGGLKLWCKLASTCTWLWSFWLPAEPVYFLNDSLKIQGVPWALARLREACKLSLTVSWGHVHKPSDVAKAIMEASQGLTKLETLVYSSVLRP
ncbi:g6921 [Coccomyxa viridis]|uniref:G6921 protein n=1 Tax=Coccomyxa viridis TaxID=1274662 RepID=A0ABP1G1D7_9CHLO